MRFDPPSKPYCPLAYLDFSKQWKEAAEEMDNYLHFDEWKKVDEDPFYDWKLVRKVSSILITISNMFDCIPGQALVAEPTR
jgi:hypothetical protein